MREPKRKAHFRNRTGLRPIEVIRTRRPKHENMGFGINKVLGPVNNIVGLSKGRVIRPHKRSRRITGENGLGWEPHPTTVANEEYDGGEKGEKTRLAATQIPEGREKLNN